MNGHLSNDELIARMYGLSDGNGAHLQDCGDCALRLSELEARRAGLIGQSPVAVSNDLLAAQRRSIYSRLGQAPRSRMRWVPAFAAACLLALGVAVYRPVPVPVQHVQHSDSADTQLFSEVYSMAQSTEPLAAAPLDALLDDNQ